MAVRLAQASINEWGGTHGGEAGNQKRTAGKLDGELNVRDWYDRPWPYLIRPKNPEDGKKMAATALACVKNEKIGYDQNERQTLYKQMKANNWDATKVGPCETDCSSLWGVCANSAGIPIDPVVWTGIMVDLAKKSGKFDIITDAAYLRSSAKLRKGDGLVEPGHHAVIVIDDGPNAYDDVVPEPAPAPSPDSYYNNVYVTTASLWLRKGPGTNYGQIVAMPSGTQVYVGKVENGWAEVLYGEKKGYSSMKYLKLIKAAEDAKPIDLMTTSSLHLRADAGILNKSLTIIPANTLLHCDGTYKMVGSTKWYKVAYNGKNGYSSSKYMKEVTPSTTIKFQTTGKLNMRKGPNTSYDVVQVVPYGATVTSDGSYTSAQGVRWYYCTYNGKSGYMSDMYLKKI